MVQVELQRHEGGECLEVAYDWRKSSYSGSEGGDCVEVAAHPAAVHIRDSKNPDGPIFTLAPAAWSAFAATPALNQLSVATPKVAAW